MDMHSKVESQKLKLVEMLTPVNSISMLVSILGSEKDTVRWYL